MNKIDNRFIILGIVAAVTLVGAVGLAFLFVGQTEPAAAGVLSADSMAYDFGSIPITGGVVSYVFKISNTGAGNLKLSDISTSCMCTSVILETTDSVSPRFGMHNNPAFWSKILKKGESAKLIVTFDPMAHGPNAVGPVTRVVRVKTNDSQYQTFTITANVVR